MCRSPRSDSSLQVIFAVFPGTGRRQPLISSKILQRHNLAESRPGRIILTGDSHPTILTCCWKDAMGTHDIIPITSTLQNLTRQFVVQDSRCQQMDRSFSLRQVNMLACAGFTAVLKGGHECRNHEARRNPIGISEVRSRRRPVGPARQLVKPRYGSCHVAVTGHHGSITRLPHQTTRHHDDPRVNCLEVFIIKPPGFHCLGREGLRHHIRPSHQIEDDLLACGI